MGGAAADASHPGREGEGEEEQLAYRLCLTAFALTLGGMSTDLLRGRMEYRLILVIESECVGCVRLSFRGGSSTTNDHTKLAVHHVSVLLASHKS